MKIFLAAVLLAASALAQKKGSDEIDATLMEKLMMKYMDLKLGDDYKSPYTNLADYVTFTLYTRDNRLLSQKLVVGDEDSLKKSNFKPSKPTYFVVHGYLNNGLAPAVQAPKNALLAKYDCNVIGVDWGKIAITYSYPLAAAEVSNVGAYVAQLIKFMRTSGKLNLKTTTVIGHSLGAQIAGFTGKNLKGLGLARITGLDPALPGFAFADSTGRIADTDAQFVDCIHTNAGGLGFEKAICQADFYPNGGKFQPGCPTIDMSGTCSHLRSIDLYTESVSSKKQFKATKCSSVPDDKGTGCSRSNAVMGEPAKPSNKGIFYVKTNSKSPYVP